MIVVTLVCTSCHAGWESDPNNPWPLCQLCGRPGEVRDRRFAVALSQ